MKNQKHIQLLLIYSLTCISTSLFSSNGDVNGDGKIGLAEAIHALQVTAGLRTVDLSIAPFQEGQFYGVFETQSETVSYPDNNGIIIENLNNVDWQANTTYLLETDTVYETENGLTINVDNITIRAYGNGKRPIIRNYSESSGVGASGVDDFKIQGIAVENHGLNTVGIGSKSCKRIIIDDCLITGGGDGIGSYLCSEYVIITNTRVHNVNDDGLFINSSNLVILSNTEISHVNKLIYDPMHGSGGDCFQTADVPYVFVDRCYFDHSSAPGKQVVFMQGHQEEIIFQNSIFRAYLGKWGEHGNVGVVLGWTSTESPDYYVIFRGNKVEGGSILLKAYGNLQVYDNILLGEPGISGNAIHTVPTGPTSIYNNIMGRTNVTLGGWGGSEGLVAEYYNNIFLEAYVDPFIMSQAEGSYNCFLEKMDRFNTFSFEADPKLSDIDNNDFSLQDDSPCIGTGKDAVNIGLINIDNHGDVNYPIPNGAFKQYLDKISYTE